MRLFSLLLVGVFFFFFSFLRHRFTCSGSTNGRFAIMLHHTNIIDSIFSHSTKDAWTPSTRKLCAMPFILMNSARFIAVALKIFMRFLGFGWRREQKINASPFEHERNCFVSKRFIQIINAILNWPNKVLLINTPPIQSHLMEVSVFEIDDKSPIDAFAIDCDCVARRETLNRNYCPFGVSSLFHSLSTWQSNCRLTERWPNKCCSFLSWKHRLVCYLQKKIECVGETVFFFCATGGEYRFASAIRMADNFSPFHFQTIAFNFTALATSKPSFWCWINFERFNVHSCFWEKAIQFLSTIRNHWKFSTSFRSIRSKNQFHIIKISTSTFNHFDIVLFAHLLFIIYSWCSLVCVCVCESFSCFTSKQKDFA